MYKIVLVDDEPWSLKGINQVFQWQNEGFSPVMSTTNPEEALEFISKEKIDAVFTDIRMPEITGLQLMKLARERGVDSEFIFVSGFAEFDYVQQALKEGAFDYFLKPISPSDAAALLKKLKNQLEIKRLHNDVEEYDSFIEGRVSPQHILTQRKFPVSDKNFFGLTVIIPDKRMESNVFGKFAEFSSFLEFYLGSGKYSFIISTELDEEKTLLFIEDIASEHTEICIGISGVSRDILQMPRLLKEAELAIHERFVRYRTGKFLYHKTSNAVVKNLLTSLTKAVEASEEAEWNKILDTMPALMSEKQLGIQEVLFFWNQLTAYLTSKYEEDQLDRDIEFMDIDQLTSRFKDLEDVCAYIKSIFQSFNAEQHLAVPQDATDAFKELFAYVNENYLMDLSLKELSDKFHIGFTYASSLFKKHIRKNFSEYISDLRMKKAVQLMSDPTLTIEEICFQAGYNDYYYFNRTFKKHYGVPPFKYRKQIKFNK